MANPDLELWDQAINGLKGMSCETNAFDFTDYEELNKWMNKELNRCANSGT